MTNNNTMSKGYYLFEHIFWGILTLIWFNNILFLNIEGLTYDQSRHFLWCTIILSLTVGAVITWKKRRNNLSLFVNVIIPYELYSLIAYYHTVYIFTWSLIAVSLLLSIMYVVLVLKPKIRAKARKEAVIKARLIRSFLGTRTVVACCLSIMVLVLGVSSFFGVLFFSPSENPVKRSSGEEVTIANNIEVVSLLEEEEWSTLSTPAKLNVLQTVANIETYYLGLPHELNVIAGPLPENTMACYNDRTHVITINIDHLEVNQAHDILDSLCHEARHAYQHRLCDVHDSISEEQRELLVFYNIQMYKQEFSNYVDGKEDAFGYYYQSCESDARAYGRGILSAPESAKMKTAYIAAPLVGSICCGSPEEENVEEYVSLPVSLFGKGDFYILRAKGDSMVDAGITEGDLLVIERNCPASEGDIVVALDQEQQNTLKRYVGFDNDEKCFILAYENEARYPGEVIKLKSFEVQGVARHVIKAL